jgi:hypothetical protein
LWGRLRERGLGYLARRQRDEAKERRSGWFLVIAVGKERPVRWISWGVVANGAEFGKSGADPEWQEDL